MLQEKDGALQSMQMQLQEKVQMENNKTIEWGKYEDEMANAINTITLDSKNDSISQDTQLETEMTKDTINRTKLNTIDTQNAPQRETQTIIQEKNITNPTKEAQVSLTKVSQTATVVGANVTRLDNIPSGESQKTEQEINPPTGLTKVQDVPRNMSLPSKGNYTTVHKSSSQGELEKPKEGSNVRSDLKLEGSNVPSDLKLVKSQPNTVQMAEMGLKPNANAFNSPTGGKTEEKVKRIKNQLLEAKQKKELLANVLNKAHILLNKTKTVP